MACPKQGKNKWVNWTQFEKGRGNPDERWIS